jgi:integrase
MWQPIRCRGGCRLAGSGLGRVRASPLVRATRQLPRILSPAEVDALTAALRTHRDRAMVAAMILGGLRRCEVLGPRLEDLRAAERRLFIAEGKGGRQRLIPVSGRFFAAAAAYLDAERPPGARSDRVFRVLKGHTAGSRCPSEAWMRSSVPPGGGPGWSTRPATSCATLA